MPDGLFPNDLFKADVKNVTGPDENKFYTVNISENKQGYISKDDPEQFFFWKITEEDETKDPTLHNGSVRMFRTRPDTQLSTILTLEPSDDNMTFDGTTPQTLYAAFQEFRKAELIKDNAEDEIKDPIIIDHYTKKGFLIATNSGIANGRYKHGVDGTQYIYGAQRTEIHYPDETKIVMTVRQYQVYSAFPTVALYPNTFTYNDLRRILDQVNYIIDENAYIIEDLFKRLADEKITRGEFNDIIQKFAMLTGVRIESVKNGDISFSVTEPIKTIEGLHKYPSADLLNVALAGYNLAPNYGLKPKYIETPEDAPKIKETLEQAAENRTKEINQMLSISKNKTTKFTVTTEITPYKQQIKLVHTTPQKQICVNLPIIPATFSKNANFYVVWYELIRMATFDRLKNVGNPDAETSEICVPYSFFSDNGLYSRAEDVKRALCNGDDFASFILGIQATTIPNKNASEYSIYNTVKKRKKRNGQPLKTAEDIFTRIKFNDKDFCIKYSPDFEWEIFASYFTVFPEGWQGLPDIPRSILQIILNQYRVNISAVKVRAGINAHDVAPKELKLTNRQLQKYCLGKSEKTTQNPTTQIKKPIIKAVNTLNQWLIGSQTPDKQINISFYGNVGYGSITDFLDNCGIIVNFGSAYINYAEEMINARVEEIREMAKISKQKKQPQIEKK